MFMCRRCEKLVERRYEELTQTFRRRIDEVLAYVDESVRNLGAGKDANLQAVDERVHELEARVRDLEARVGR